MKSLFKLSLIVIMFSCNHKDKNHHPRIGKIPLNAKWVGGVDGGYWIQIVKVTSGNNIEIKIYDENSGELYNDKIYQINAECKDLSLDSTGLINNFNAYDGEKILLKNARGNRSCYLW